MEPVNRTDSSGFCNELSVSRQAFLEMNSEEAAQNMVGYYSTVMPVIRHHPVFVQFSNHKELKTDNSPNQEVTLSTTAMHSAASRRRHVFTVCPSVVSQRAQAALRALSSSHVDTTVAAPSTVLRVVVENLVYPVTLDALCQVTFKVQSPS